MDLLGIAARVAHLHPIDGIRALMQDPIKPDDSLIEAVKKKRYNTFVSARTIQMLQNIANVECKLQACTQEQGTPAQQLETLRSSEFKGLRDARLTLIDVHCHASFTRGKQASADLKALMVDFQNDVAGGIRHWESRLEQAELKGDSTGIELATTWLNGSTHNGTLAEISGSAVATQYPDAPNSPSDSSDASGLQEHAVRPCNEAPADDPYDDATSEYSSDSDSDYPTPDYSSSDWNSDADVDSVFAPKQVIVGHFRRQAAMDLSADHFAGPGSVIETGEMKNGLNLRRTPWQMVLAEDVVARLQGQCELKAHLVAQSSREVEMDAETPNEDDFFGVETDAPTENTPRAEAHNLNYRIALSSVESVYYTGEPLPAHVPPVPNVHVATDAVPNDDQRRSGAAAWQPVRERIAEWEQRIQR
ncbi:hypothetical protein [Stenotrophomonas sp. 278]|uniref:hypothetical protein n=1 Tax=Stenotrophomonas sp. 278 TaxID=2479851 RepID=UPI000F68F299|nr:hypothetical protein [Stenotrophomonas sp. 278]RRU04556.1 hypothetical protein EGJ34_18670 [Stenotrophomonas sp. 278]